jgi:Ca2+-binding RTX toxin-like protein
MKVRFLMAGAAALIALALAPAASSAAPAFKLRVEAPGQTLDPGTMYVPRNPIAVQRGESLANGNCTRGSGSFSVGGRTALGLAASASNANKALQPLWVVEDSFGRRVCRIAGFNETDTPFTGWLFRVNNEAPPVSAELSPVGKGDEVLWVFADFGSGANTGDELVIEAPVRTTPGVVQVQVNAVTFDGQVAPAPDGTVVSGGTAPATTTGGSALVPVAAGTATLRAEGAGVSPTEIPSLPLSVCAAPDVSDCPPARGRTIVGTNLKDNLKGGGGPDVIRTRGGADKVRVKGGGSDRVDCGKGRDVVIADRTDKVKRCERAGGRKGKRKGKKRGKRAVRL